MKVWLGGCAVATGIQSTSTAQASGAARLASDSPPARELARAGLTARGILYVLLGWVAILVALGQTSRQADQQGALQLLADEPYGLVSLGLLGIGFAGYALWRLSEAAFGVTGEGNGAGADALARRGVHACHYLEKARGTAETGWLAGPRLSGLPATRCPTGGWVRAGTEA